MKSKNNLLLLLALAITSATAWSCSKSTAPAADDKPAAPAAATAAAPAASAASAAASAAKPVASAASAAKPAVSAAAVPVAAKPGASAVAAKPSGPDARMDIKTAIPEAIRLLETKDYANFVKNFMPPSQLAQMPIPVDQLVAMMTADPGAAAQFNTMIETLKRIQGMTPTMDATGNKATYTLDPPIGTDKAVSLVKENGLWYLGD